MDIDPRLGRDTRGGALHYGRPGRFVVGGPRLGGDRRRLAVCVPCLREGFGSEAWIARVWRAVGLGILNAGANGGPARWRTAVSPRIGTNRRRRGGCVAGTCGMGSMPTGLELTLACSLRNTQCQPLSRTPTAPVKQRAAKQSSAALPRAPRAPLKRARAAAALRCGKMAVSR